MTSIMESEGFWDFMSRLPSFVQRIIFIIVSTIEHITRELTVNYMDYLDAPVLIPFLIFVLCISVLLYTHRKKKKQKKLEKKAALAKRDAKQLYLLCVEHGITGVDSTNIVKAKQLAKKNGLKKSEEEIKQLFRDGARLVREEKQAKQAELQRKQREEAKQVYLLCKENGINELTPANLERLKLLVAKKGLKKTEGEIKQAFQDGKAKEDRERIAKQVEEECAVVNYHKKYSSYIGRKKRVQMYLDLAEAHQEKSNEYYGKYVGLIRTAVKYADLTAEKEHDWAIAGGIASGLAGGAAGVATAVNVQRKNEQIRERNAANQAAAVNMTKHSQERYFKLSVEEESKAKAYKEKAEQAEVKLVSELPQQELLTAISPKLVCLETTETGNKKIRVQFTTQKRLTIYENVSAVVDGSVKVCLIDKSTSKKIGETIICLGKDGVSAPTTEETFFTNVAGDDNNCDVIFEPYHLWAIEI